MFTGIVEVRGRVVSLERSGDGARLAVAVPLDLSDTRIGDSIAVDGCCLTAVRVTDGRFEAEASRETLRVTTLGDLRAGAEVNIERALRVGDRLGGHLVQGHVDTTGALVRRMPNGIAEDIHIRIPVEHLPFIAPKGSITVDGISLTVNGVDRAAGTFFVTVIPHTSKVTTLGGKAAGARVNVETDVLAKYVLNAVSGGTGGGLTMERLEDLGFA